MICEMVKADSSVTHMTVLFLLVFTKTVKINKCCAKCVTGESPIKMSLSSGVLSDFKTTCPCCESDKKVCFYLVS